MKKITLIHLIVLSFLIFAEAFQKFATQYSPKERVLKLNEVTGRASSQD